MKALLFGALALMIGGCGFSPQTHYYSLTPVESTQPIAATGPLLQVSHVTIPAVLDRDALVQWVGSGEVKISGSNRWAAPLDGLIQAALAADLRHELPGLVLLPGNPIPSGDVRSIVVNVRHFAAENSTRVVLLADWSLVAGRPTSAILTRSEAISLPIHSTRSSEVVPVMSNAIALLSERIANTIYSAGQVTARR